MTIAEAGIVADTAGAAAWATGVAAAVMIKSGGSTGTGAGGVMTAESTVGETVERFCSVGVTSCVAGAGFCEATGAKGIGGRFVERVDVDLALGF